MRWSEASWWPATRHKHAVSLGLTPNPAHRPVYPVPVEPVVLPTVRLPSRSESTLGSSLFPMLLECGPAVTPVKLVLGDCLVWVGVGLWPVMPLVVLAPSIPGFWLLPVTVLWGWSMWRACLTLSVLEHSMSVKLFNKYTWGNVHAGMVTWACACATGRNRAAASRTTSEHIGSLLRGGFGCVWLHCAVAVSLACSDARWNAHLPSSVVSCACGVLLGTLAVWLHGVRNDGFLDLGHEVLAAGVRHDEWVIVRVWLTWVKV